MSSDHEAVAESYASTARMTIDAVEQTEENMLQLATAEATLAVYYQLKSMKTWD